MKNISLFVSSTFNDMQSERDLIREKVAPELTAVAAKYGYNVDFIDLRWGINTKDMSETDANRKILQTCFDEIRKSRPFFVALLGERYGWIPDSEDVITAYQNSDVEPSKQDLDKSITELEIECALRSFPFMDRSLFYFREPIDYGKDENAKRAYVSQGKEKKKLDLLKKRITEKYPNQIFSYDGVWDSDSQRVTELEDLEQSLIENIRQAIENELAIDLAPQNPVEESVNVTDSLIDATNVGFAGRVDELTTISEFLHAPNERLLVLVGESGCGKSSLMSKASEQANLDGYCVLPFFTGCHEHALTVENMVRSTIWRIAKILDVAENVDDNTDSKQLLKRFYELLNTLALTRRTVLLVDAINQFAVTPMEENLAWLNLFALSPALKVVLSTTNNYSKIKQIRALGAKIVDVDYFDDNDVALVTRKFFDRNHRQVNDALVSAVVNKGQGVCHAPVYLMTLLMELNSIGREDFAAIRKREKELNETAIDAILNYLTDMANQAPESQEQLLSDFLARAKQKVGNVCDLFVCAVALSRRGLNERLVERICHEMGVNFEAADFAYFRKLFGVHLVQRENGAWDFNHLLVKESFVNSFSTELRKEIVSATIAVLASEHNENAFKKSEYAYYLALANRLDEYVSYFVAMQQDATVQKALHTELINTEKHVEVADKLLIPVTEDTVVVRNFVIQCLANGQLPFAHGERLIERVLSSIYTEKEYFSHPIRLKEIFDAYCALGNAATNAGYHALAKDYLLMAISLAEKCNADKSLLYGQLADCCHRLGQTLSARVYQHKGKRLLLSSGLQTAEKCEQLLTLLEEQVKRKIDEILPPKKTVLTLLHQMQETVNTSQLDEQKTNTWYAKIIDLAAKGGVYDERISDVANKCATYADSTKDSTLKANIYYSVATLYADDVQTALPFATKAYQCIKRVLSDTTDGQSLKLLTETTELLAYFNRDNEQGREFERERVESLARLNSIDPSYQTLHQYVSSTKGHSDARKDAISAYHKLSRGQTSQEQKTADKIIMAIAIVVIAIVGVIMPVRYSIFRSATVFGSGPTTSRYFFTFANTCIEALFESSFNMLVCFGAYGLLTIFKPNVDYALRKRWAIRCAIFFGLAACILVGFYFTWNYLVYSFVYTSDFFTTAVPYLIVLASELLLVMCLLNELMIFVAREQQTSPAHRNYRKFVSEYPSRALSYLLNILLFVVIGFAYWYYVIHTELIMVGYKLTLSLVFPVTMFAILFVLLMAFTVARFVRLTVLYFVFKRKTAQKSFKRKKAVNYARINCLILVAVFVVGIAGVTISSFVNGDTPAALSIGSGTEDDPYIIREVKQMNNLLWITISSDSQKYTEGKYFKLETDVNYQSLAKMNEYGFYGHFDGNGHTITIPQNRWLFQFLKTGASISNLTVKTSMSVTEEGYYYGLVRTIESGATLDNCTVICDVSLNMEKYRIDQQGGYDIYLGCFAAYNYGTISNCHYTGKMISENTDYYIDSKYSYVYLSGFAPLGGGTIEKCSANIEVDLAVCSSDFCFNAFSKNSNVKNSECVGDVKITFPTYTYNQGIFDINLGQTTNIYVIAEKADNCVYKGNFVFEYQLGAKALTTHIVGLSTLDTCSQEGSFEIINPNPMD